MNQSSIWPIIVLFIICFLIYIRLLFWITGSKIQIETDEEFEARKAVEAWARLNLKPPEK